MNVIEKILFLALVATIQFTNPAIAESIGPSDATMGATSPVVYESRYSLPAVRTAFYDADDPSAQVFPGRSLSASRGRRQPSGRITGPTQGLDPTLVRRLNQLSRHFGETVQITPHGGCRERNSKRYHRRSYGCSAADLTMDGVSGPDILRWWRDNGGGGRGRYRGRSFVHVDVGYSRAWAWGYHNPGRYMI